jgi:hypothetical protein
MGKSFLPISGGTYRGGAKALWTKRRRVLRLQDEIAAARADQAELRRRLEVFEMIAGAAGASLVAPAWRGAAGPASRMPANLVAAAREQSPREVPVRLEVGGSEVIAVISGPGDPREWWSAVCQVTGKVSDDS